MKKLLLFTAALIIFLSSVYPQNLMDYVSAVKGDTLVIKDYYEMNNKANSLYNALFLDTINVPAGRVYELIVNGYYPLINNLITFPDRTTIIAGSDPTMVVNNKNVNSAPPLICAEVMEAETLPVIFPKGNLIIKNCELVPADKSGTSGWAISAVESQGLNLIFDNCIMERNRWAFAAIMQANCNITFRNCYFVNMSGSSSMHYGGVFYSVYDQDTLLVENCTHVMAQGALYWFRNYSFKRIIFNHNTFVNCAGPVFMNPGYQTNMSIANNIFINSNVQPFHPSCYTNFEPLLRPGTIPVPDPDERPMGLVNVNPYSLNGADSTRKIFVEANAAYWDSSLLDLADIANINRVNGVDNWQSQMIRMNDRTQVMFDDEINYINLTEGVWYLQKPDFTETKDLFTTQLANLKTFALTAIDTLSTVYLPEWRLINTEFENYIHPDWPIPIDFSYSDYHLLRGSITGLPVGDLNWFPAEKVAWLAHRKEEYAAIHDGLYGGRVSVESINPLPLQFRVEQNYPNPFNPSTTISFSIPKASYIILKVYNIIGQEVVTLLEGFETPQTYNLKFDGTGLASGVYFYCLTVNGINQVRKMVLAK